MICKRLTQVEKRDRDYVNDAVAQSAADVDDLPKLPVPCALGLRSVRVLPMLYVEVLLMLYVEVLPMLYVEVLPPGLRSVEVPAPTYLANKKQPPPLGPP